MKHDMGPGRGIRGLPGKFGMRPGQPVNLTVRQGLRALVAGLVAVGLVVSGLAGCGGGEKSARAVAEAFLTAMKNQKYDQAALLWDYETQARKDNEDWDSIVESQRKLIIGKLAEEHAKVLERWGQHFPQAAKIVEFNETGESAQAILDGARVGGMKLKLGSDGWRVTGFD